MFHIQMATGKRFVNKNVVEGEHFSRPSLDGPLQVLGLSTPIDIALANAAFAAMRLDDAIDYARGAVELCERTGITLHGSFSKALLAFVLLKQDSPSADDHALARRMLEAAAHDTKNLLGINEMARQLLSA